MRIYVPATLDELDTVDVGRTSARWSLTPRPVHGVTRALIAELPDEDTEGVEYAAFLDAAAASLALLAARPGTPPLRAVVTVEVPDHALEPVGTGADTTSSELRLTEPVPDVPIVCVHADEPDAAPDVTAVRSAAEADDDAALADTVQRATDRDLLWYDWSEVGAIPR
ncbi:DUF6912 family protein [Myceligenerans pegani]|uniref:Uncharacterized protein n=1 Tax=Myceligenerans pegani TaxID=2776917 RepID=A0ABR9N161_9MICO|nr:hypothetical protein [Myceligenerans sp. TRM 65318]MBE1877369.1 hypothetical protein [Myceligenerans sp. TRM 65318]MBE3019640.1 hypothetical protein [Myceligenerans sp. TRM 65318]